MLETLDYSIRTGKYTWPTFFVLCSKYVNIPAVLRQVLDARLARATIVLYKARSI